MVVTIFFLEKCMGTKSTIHAVLQRWSHLTRRRSLARTIQHTFSNSHKNCSEIGSVDKIMGNKMHVMIEQRISRSGKGRRKLDFSRLYHNAAFFSMRGNLKMRLPCITPISSAPLFTVTSRGKREPTGDKVHNVRVMIFLRVFFLLFQTIKTCFFLMNYNKFVSTAHANEWIVCCVCNDWRITETVPSMWTCPISGRPERWHFWLYIKNYQIKTQNNILILCISSTLYLFIGIYSTSMQASDTCYSYCIIQMTMCRENDLLAQAHMSQILDSVSVLLMDTVSFIIFFFFLLKACYGDKIHFPLRNSGLLQYKLELFLSLANHVYSDLCTLLDWTTENL